MPSRGDTPPCSATRRDTLESKKNRWFPGVGAPPAVRVWVRFRGRWWGGREGGALQVDRASAQPPSPWEDKLTAQSLSLLRRKGIVTGQTSPPPPPPSLLWPSADRVVKHNTLEGNRGRRLPGSLNWQRTRAVVVATTPLVRTPLSDGPRDELRRPPAHTPPACHVRSAYCAVARARGLRRLDG